VLGAQPKERHLYRNPARRSGFILQRRREMAREIPWILQEALPEGWRLVRPIHRDRRGQHHRVAKAERETPWNLLIKPALQLSLKIGSLAHSKLARPQTELLRKSGHEEQIYQPKAWAAR
jgi:hypothetical protein